MNTADEVLFAQPRTADARAKVAEACVLHLNFRMPMLLEALDNRVDTAYAALPERLYVVDRGGCIAYRGEPGPWGFDVDGWDKAILEQIEAAATS